jgi:hypothetical protein
MLGIFARYAILFFDISVYVTCLLNERKEEFSSRQVANRACCGRKIEAEVENVIL